MDIEQLNKSQIVLLTLLVSFMTSIATGIVTVALMQQAPPAITQTVNRVIEHTVEKVAPGQTAAAVAAPAQQVAAVKESDAIPAAVAKASPSLVRLYTSATTDPTFLGLGLVLDGSGIVAADSSALGDDADAVAELPNSSHARLFVVARDSATGIAYLSPSADAAGATPPSWKAATLSTVRALLGQSAIALSGRTTVRLGIGAITSAEALSASAKDGPQVLGTNIKESDILPGSPLMDMDGAILGVSTAVSRASSPQAFISAQAIVIPAKESAPAKQ